VGTGPSDETARPVRSSHYSRDGHFYCNWTGLWRWCALPEQKAEPEDPKLPSELLMADRGGLVFTPKIASPGRGRTGFHQSYPSIMTKFNISPETVNCHAARMRYECRNWAIVSARNGRGITSRVVKNLIDKRTKVKECIEDASLEVGQR